MDLYLSNQQQFAGDTYFILRTHADPSRLTLTATRAVQEVDPEQSVFDMQRMDQRIASAIWQRRAAGMLSLVFGALALTPGAIGVYGVLAYNVSQRTREIGIRIALGARPGGIIATVIGDGLRPVAFGLIAGVAGAAAAGRWLQGFLYRAAPLDPAVLAGVALLLLVAGLGACSIPALRVARVDPTISLRDL